MDFIFLSEGDMLPQNKPANLRTVAEQVGLAPCSVSAILNNTPASQAIPQSTKDRVFRAAAELNYRPNPWARSLRTKRTGMITVITADFGRAAVARVVAGLQSRLNRSGYLLVLGAADSADSIHSCAQFMQHGIEGVVAIDAAVPRQLDIPVAYVDLAYLGSDEPLSRDTQAWLSELGAAAADTIIRQIETGTASKRTKVEPKFSPAYFDVLHANLDPDLDARESA